MVVNLHSPVDVGLARARDYDRLLALGESDLLHRDGLVVVGGRPEERGHALVPHYGLQSALEYLPQKKPGTV